MGIVLTFKLKLVEKHNQLINNFSMKQLRNDKNKMIKIK